MDKFQRQVLFIVVSVLLTVVSDARRTPLGCANNRWLQLPSDGLVSAVAPRSGVYCYRSRIGSPRPWSLSSASTKNVRLCSINLQPGDNSLELKDCISRSVRDGVFAVVVGDASGAKYELSTAPNARRTLVGDVPIRKRDIDCDDDENKDKPECQDDSESQESSESHHSENSESESDTDDEGLSKGAIAGIAIGSIVLAGGIITAGVCLCCVCKSKRKSGGGSIAEGDEDMDMDSLEGGHGEGELPAPGAPLPAEGIPTVVEGEKFDAKFDGDSDDEAEDSDDEHEEESNDIGAIL